MWMNACGGVEGARVQPRESEGLLGGVEAGPSHHDLGHPSLPSPLDYLVQVPRELLVGQVCPNVYNDIVGQLIHHTDWLAGVLKQIKIIFLVHSIFFYHLRV